MAPPCGANARHWRALASAQKLGHASLIQRRLGQAWRIPDERRKTAELTAQPAERADRVQTLAALDDRTISCLAIDTRTWQILLPIEVQGWREGENVGHDSILRSN